MKVIEHQAGNLAHYQAMIVGLKLKERTQFDFGRLVPLLYLKDRFYFYEHKDKILFTRMVTYEGIRFGDKIFIGLKIYVTNFHWQHFMYKLIVPNVHRSKLEDLTGFSEYRIMDGKDNTVKVLWKVRPLNPTIRNTEPILISTMSNFGDTAK